MCDFIFNCDGACVGQHHPPAQRDELLLLVFDAGPRCANIASFSERQPSFFPLAVLCFSNRTHTLWRVIQRAKQMYECESRDSKLHKLPMNNLSGTCVCVCVRGGERGLIQLTFKKTRFILIFLQHDLNIKLHNGASVLLSHSELKTKTR